MRHSQNTSKSSADVIVIGSGAAGSVAALTLADAGKKVVIVEQSRLGGDAANFGDIPTKSLLEFARMQSSSQEYPRFSPRSLISNKIDIEAIKNWRQSSISKTGILHSSKAYKDKNIKVFRGHGHFVGPKTLAVGLSRLTASDFIIATGTELITPDIEGIDSIPYITYRTFETLNQIPKSVAIIGGGPIAYEYSQVFLSLGSKVKVFTQKAHMLDEFDNEISDLAAAELYRKGASVLTQSSIKNVHQTPSGVFIGYDQVGQRHHSIVDCVFVAGKLGPNLDLGLENAHVHATKNGIQVNSKLQTSQEHIYAVGGVTNATRTTSSAIRQAQIVAHNIVHRKKTHYSQNAVPVTIFGDPSIASVGTNETHIKLSGEFYQTSIAPIGIVSRAYSSPYDKGLVKIIANTDGTVIGASIVAPHATELINELALAVNLRLKACDLSNTVHVFSSWSEAIRVASSKIHCS